MKESWQWSLAIGPCTAMVQSTVRELQLSRSVKFFYPYPSPPFHVIIFYFLALTGNYGKSNSVYCITVVSILKFLETCIHFSNFLHCLFIADISHCSHSCCCQTENICVWWQHDDDMNTTCQLHPFSASLLTDALLSTDNIIYRNNSRFTF